LNAFNLAKPSNLPSYGCKFFNQNKETGNDNDQIIPYYVLRVLIGAAGICLPFLLVIGKLIYNGTFQLEYSISDYYDNGTAGDILVGCTICPGIFFSFLQGLRTHR
jgi:hypothetical protein